MTRKQNHGVVVEHLTNFKNLDSAYGSKTKTANEIISKIGLKNEKWLGFPKELRNQSNKAFKSVYNQVT